MSNEQIIKIIKKYTNNNDPKIYIYSKNKNFIEFRNNLKITNNIKSADILILTLDKNDIIKHVIKIINDNITKILLLIVPKEFKFNDLVINSKSNNIDAISWYGIKDYYCIIVKNDDYDDKLIVIS